VVAGAVTGLTLYSEEVDGMQLHGIGIGQGLAVGPVLRMPEPLPEPAHVPSALGVDAENERAAAALVSTTALLRARGERAGGTAKDVLDALALMVEDAVLRADVVVRIESGATAERAVFEAFARFRDLLSGMGGYMGERATDLADVSQQVVADLSGIPVPVFPIPPTPSSSLRATLHRLTSRSSTGIRSSLSSRVAADPLRTPRLWPERGRSSLLSGQPMHSPSKTELLSSWMPRQV
jgi:hypothetical protein